MRWPKLRRAPEPADAVPEWTWPAGWHVKLWGINDVVPEQNRMHGYVTLFHNDGFAYQIWDCDVPGSNLRDPYTYREILEMVEHRRLARDRSRLPYMPLTTDGMDDATIRPCGAGVWTRDIPCGDELYPRHES